VSLSERDVQEFADRAPPKLDASIPRSDVDPFSEANLREPHALQRELRDAGPTLESLPLCVRAV
jgi:hypothetical protein